MNPPRPRVLALSIVLGYLVAHPLLALADDAATAPANQLPTVEISAARGRLDAARNGLSPDTGSSVYRIDRQDIKNLPQGDSTPLNQPMLRLARDLGVRYRIGMITDNPSDRMAHITQQHGLNSLFEPIVVSANLGSSKHTPEIFHRALDLTCSQPSQTIFIDNTETNLAVARQLGIHVIHHDDATNDVARLRSTLAATHGLLFAGAA